jgi:hypothetical protein
MGDGSDRKNFWYKGSTLKMIGISATDGASGRGRTSATRPFVLKDSSTLLGFSQSLFLELS